jgi:hypothetical protein
MSIILGTGFLAVLVTMVIGLIFQTNVPTKETTREIRNNLWSRYLEQAFPTNGLALKGAKIHDADRLLSYLERVVDRQINKARGILPFNSVILTFLSIERRNIPYTPQDTNQLHLAMLGALFAVMIGLALSSMLCLIIFLVRWKGNYSTFSGQVALTLALIRKRSSLIEWATVISGVCLIFATVVIAFAESRPQDCNQTTANIIGCG